MVLDYFNLHIMFTAGGFRSLVFQFEVGSVLITHTFKILFSNSYETVDDLFAFLLYSGLVNLVKFSFQRAHTFPSTVEMFLDVFFTVVCVEDFPVMTFITSFITPGQI